MDRRRSVRVQVAQAPRFALRVGGLKVVQQLLIVQVPQPRAVVRHTVGISGDEEIPLLVAVRPLVHRPQVDEIPFLEMDQERGTASLYAPHRSV